MNAAHPARPFAPDDLLDDAALAEYLGITPQHIRRSRMRRPTWVGPPVIEISPKKRRYLFSDVLEWAKARRVDPADRIGAGAA